MHVKARSLKTENPVYRGNDVNFARLFRVGIAAAKNSNLSTPNSKSRSR